MRIAQLLFFKFAFPVLAAYLLSTGCENRCHIKNLRDCFSSTPKLPYCSLTVRVISPSTFTPSRITAGYFQQYFEADTLHLATFTYHSQDPECVAKAIQGVMWIRLENSADSLDLRYMFILKDAAGKEFTWFADRNGTVEVGNMRYAPINGSSRWLTQVTAELDRCADKTKNPKM